MSSSDSEGPSREAVEPSKTAEDTLASHPDTPRPSDAAPPSPPDAPKGPSMLQKIKITLKPKIPIFKLQIKAAIPPTIAIAIYESDAVSRKFTTLGYLVAVISILGFCVMPRAKFFQNLAISLLATCLGAAMVLLGLWSAVQARIHTSPPGRPSPPYNSSASAVNAIWLFFNIFMVNGLRSAYPQFNLPTITYAIFVNVAFTYGPIFTSTHQVTSFVVRLIEAFLTGLALATAVHVVIFPMNTRRPVFGTIKGLLNNVKGLMNAQSAYIAAFESENPFEPRSPVPLLPKKKSPLKSVFSRRTADLDVKKPPRKFLQEETAALKKSMSGMLALFAKLFADLPFAKREFAYGKLNAADLQELHKLLREASLPLLGVASVSNIFERVSLFQGWDHLFTKSATDMPDTDDDAQSMARESFEEWRDIMLALREPLARINDSMAEAIQHVLLRLELIPTPPAKDDVESKSQDPVPGDDAFAAYFQAKITRFQDSKHDTLKEWCQKRNIPFPTHLDAKLPSFVNKETATDSPPSGGERRRRALFVLLFMEHLLLSSAKALLDIVKFADQKVSDGTMARKRLITPGQKRLRKWLFSVFSSENGSDENLENVGQPDPLNEIYLGDSLNGLRKDPEHLPPVGFWQHVGNAIRIIPRTLRSKHAAFALRAAVATLSVAIIAYLKASQEFFIRQRLLWALVMVAFSMARTSGLSTFNFVMRIFGTVVAMIASLVVWYIVDGKTAGVIVFLFLWIATCFYVVLTMPQFTIVGVLSAVSSVLIVGYELQVRKIGVTLAESNGQPAYPIYLLAPYRLAAVAGGLFVAWIWTIFPYPVTEQSELRLTTAATLHAAASHYALVHEMYLMRLKTGETYLGDRSVKGSPAARLEKELGRTFSRTYVLLSQAREAARFGKFSASMGGRFPLETYMTMTDLAERIVRCTSLISYASRSFMERDETDSNSSVWKADFRALMTNIGPTSRDITSRLAILASALSNAQPLPPHLGPIQSLQLIERLSQIDMDILSVRHLEEPGYSAFAVCQVAARSIIRNLNDLTDLTRSLVGELDFSYNVVPRSMDVSTDSESGSGSSSRDGPKGPKQA